MIFGSKNVQINKLKQQLAQLEKENSILKTTLEFYADTKNWQEGHKYRDDDDATIFTDGSESGVSVDKGSRAYRALKSIENS